MASIVTYSGGLRRIEFSMTPNGPRKLIRLGRMRRKAAESVNAMIEAIIGDKLACRPHDAETSKWLGELDEKMLAKLRAVGLAEGVGLTQTTLGGFMVKFFDNLTGKPATRISYGNVRRNLEGFFGPTRLLTSITLADADAWRKWMVEHEETDANSMKKVKRLSIPTVSRRVIAVRTMFRTAIRWNLLRDNPFEGVKTGQQTNEKRKAFVSSEDVEQVMRQTPDAEWKLIIALARYGGLRCPSEHYALRWGDVDWENSRMTVHAPKTEHHEGQGARSVPIFSELRPHLMAAFEQAEAGTEYVIARHRLGCMNLRQQMERFIRRAGVKQWPKLFHNLRASRETELMRKYDLATVCKWIGNSPAVAAKHYATSVDLSGDFRRAAGIDAETNTNKAQQKAQQTAVASEGPAMTDEVSKNEKTPENRGLVETCQAASNADLLRPWAVQGSNL
jgi:integrase